jgi:hypothetical protein
VLGVANAVPARFAYWRFTSISGNIPNTLSVRSYTLCLGASSPAHLKGRLLNNRGVALRLGSWGVRVECCRTARRCRNGRRRLFACPSHRRRIGRDARGNPRMRCRRPQPLRRRFHGVDRGLCGCDPWSTRRGRRCRVTCSQFGYCSMKIGHVRRTRRDVRTGQSDAYSSNNADTCGRSDCCGDVTPEVTAPTCLVVAKPVAVGHGLRGRYANEIRRKRHLRTSTRE